MFSVKPIVVIAKFTRPFVWFLSLSTNLILKIFGVNTEGVEEKISREEIRSLVELGEEQGAINETERRMIDDIIKFDDILAKEVMIPRIETFCIETNADIKDIMKTPCLVPETIPIDKLLNDMKDSKIIYLYLLMNMVYSQKL